METASSLEVFQYSSLVHLIPAEFNDFSIKDPYQGLSFLKKYQKKIFLDAIHPQSGAMTYWYLILMAALLYNAYVIPLRVCFTPYQTEVGLDENRKDN